MNDKRWLNTALSRLRRFIAPLAVVVAGTTLSIAAFSIVRKWEERDIRKEFEIKAENRCAALKREMEASLQVLASLQAYLDHGKVSRDEFRSFVMHFLPLHGSIQALGWVPRIPDGERREYESRARREGLSGFQISERATQGRMKRAASRSEYFPVRYVEPYRGNEIALGFDLASEPTRLEALEQSRDTGAMLATARITLVQERKGGFGFVVFAPVYRRGSATDSVLWRREHLQGFALGAFRMGDILEKSLTYLNPEGIDIFLYDRSAPENEGLLYRHASRGGRDAGASARYKYARTLDVAGRKWLAVCASTPEFGAGMKHGQSSALLAAGLLFTFLSAGYLTSNVRRTERLRLEVAERKLAEEALRRSEREKAMLNRIANCFLTVSDEETYGEVLAVVLDVLESRLGVFGFIADNGDLVVPSLSRDVWQECQVPDKSMVFPPSTWGESLWGRALRDKRGFLSNGPFHTPEGHLSVDSLLTVPILYGNEAIGLLSVANREGGYTEEEKGLLERIVASISPVLKTQLERDRKEQERQHAEEQLRLASIYNRSLIEASLDPLVTIGPDGAITDANAATEKITGCRLKELVGTDFSDYFTDPENARAAYREAFRRGAVHDWPLEIRHREGMVTPVLYNASTYRDVDGKVVGVFAAARDMSERRNLENQLRQAQKMEAVGTLAGGVAHDFNNILTAIIGFGSILEMKMAPDDPLLHNVTQILAAADRAANLIRSLLAFSRKQSIETKAVNLNDIVSGMEKMLSRLIREDIELLIHLSQDALPVLADSGQMEQVVLNLLTNARDAMPAGGKIIISSERTTLDENFKRLHGYGEPGNYALISLTDSGQGMEETTRQRIFEPFFTTKELGKGTGLGLSVCYGIIKQHNGYINCYSEQGQGTTFRIYLPLAHGGVGPEEAPVVAPQAGGTETILVAEDDATVRGLTVSILTDFGYNVLEACDGDEAVARFLERQEEIGLCLLDVIMPKKKGWEAYEEMRKIMPGVKALFMSGYQEDVSLQKGLVAEGADFVAKPVAPRELLRKVREVLDR